MSISSKYARLARDSWPRSFDSSASKKTVQGDHGDHIHVNCQCEFAIRFSPDLDIDGYDPKSLREEWDAARNKTLKKRICSGGARAEQQNDKGRQET